MVILPFRRVAAAALFAVAALVYPAAAAETVSPAEQNHTAAEVSLTYFEQLLAPFGRWFQHPVWGAVWQPNSGPNFRPYFYGYWEYTSDYGWFWVSNEPYGDIVYHYGRWAFDPTYGWLWVPGYIWGPGWVAWRDTDADGGGYIGWLPLPPGYQDFSLNTAAPSYLPDDWYGYRSFYGNNFSSDAFTGLWVFVPTQDFGVRDRRPYIIDRARLPGLYRNSRDHTDYVLDRDRDRVVDRGVDKDALERSTRRTFGSEQSSRFLRRGVPIVSLSQGQELSRRNRDARASFPGSIPLQATPVPLRNNSPAGQAGAQLLNHPSTDFSSRTSAANKREDPGTVGPPRFSGAVSKTVPPPIPGEAVARALRNRTQIGSFAPLGAPAAASLPGHANVTPSPTLPQAQSVQPLLQHGSAALPAPPAVVPPRQSPHQGTQVRP